jgi:hypothetical protein
MESFRFGLDKVGDLLMVTNTVLQSLLVRDLQEEGPIETGSELCDAIEDMIELVQQIDTWLNTEPVYFTPDVYRSDANALKDVYTTLAIAQYTAFLAKHHVQPDVEPHPSRRIAEWCALWEHWTSRRATLSDYIHQVRNRGSANPVVKQLYPDPVCATDCRAKLALREGDAVTDANMCESIEEIVNRLHDIGIHVGPDITRGCSDECQACWSTDELADSRQCVLVCTQKKIPSDVPSSSLSSPACVPDFRGPGARFAELLMMGGFRMVHDMLHAASGESSDPFDLQFVCAVHSWKRTSVLLGKAECMPAPVDSMHSSVVRCHRDLWAIVKEGAVTSSSGVLMSEIRTGMVAPLLTGFQLHLKRPLNAATVYIADSINELPPPLSMSADVAVQNGTVPRSDISENVMDSITMQSWMAASINTYLCVSVLKGDAVYLGNMGIPPDEADDGRAPQCEMTGHLSAMRNSSGGEVDVGTGWSVSSVVPTYLIPRSLQHTPESDYIMTTPERGMMPRRPVIYQIDAARWIVHTLWDPVGQSAGGRFCVCTGLAHAWMVWMVLVNMLHDGKLETGHPLTDFGGIETAWGTLERTKRKQDQRQKQKQAHQPQSQVQPRQGADDRMEECKYEGMADGDEEDEEEDGDIIMSDAVNSGTNRSEVIEDAIEYQTTKSTERPSQVYYGL